MREFVCHSIGTVHFSRKGCEIQVDSAFRKAPRGLEEFSHVLMLTMASDGRLALRTVKVDSLDRRRGVIVCGDATGVSRPHVCFLIDLKPYLPCEDRVVEPMSRCIVRGGLQSSCRTNGDFVFSSAGLVRTSGGNPYLEFAEDVPVEEGSVIRIVWWFDRFDDAKYRRITTCHPPYVTKSEIGVFASRSPVRPNPIALTTVKVLRVDRVFRRAFIGAIECYDGTPFIGVLPYDPSQDAIEGAAVGEWAKDWPDHVGFSSRTDDTVEVDRIACELDAEMKALPALRITPTAKSERRVRRPTAIVVRGARTNNLRGVDVEIPYGKITAIVGVSGSGKSSLATDTIVAECQRRMDCLGTRDDTVDSVAVDEMTGCLPVIHIAQRRLRSNIRSTVGTFSGAATHLRSLFAQLGERHYVNPGAVSFKMTPATFSPLDPDARCPACDGCGVRRIADPELIIADPAKSLLEGASPLLGRLESFVRKPNANGLKGQVIALARKMRIDLAKPWCELPADFKDLLLRGDPSLTLTFKYAAGANGRGGVMCRPLEGLLPAVERLCAEGGSSSIANRFMSESVCPVCQGERLAGEGRLVTLCGVRYPICEKMTFGELARFLDVVERECAAVETTAVRTAESCAQPYCRRLGGTNGEHLQALRSLCAAADRMGLADIELSRRTSELSGGEAQRLKLLTAFNNHLTGLLYVFAEPSQNLGRAEYGCVAGLLRELADEGNTILMVEHNPEMIAVADHVIEIGPGAGRAGGEVVGAGSYRALLSDPNTLTGRYAQNLPTPCRKSKPCDGGVFSVRNVCCHTLKNVNVDIRKGLFTCITGRSGSGKSSLMYGGILPQALSSKAFDDVIVVESRLVCTTPRSTVATYTGVMDDLRKAFAEADDRAIDSILGLDVQAAAVRLEGVCPRSAATCRLLERNGLGYLKLGQQTVTLSGGEAARLKIVCGLGVKRRKNTLYLMDEPTCGLHYSDIDRLLALVFELLENGNTVVAIEHNSRFLSAADVHILSDDFKAFPQ